MDTYHPIPGTHINHHAGIPDALHYTLVDFIGLHWVGFDGQRNNDEKDRKDEN